MVPGTIAAAVTGTDGESHESLILQSSSWTCDDHLLRNGYVGEKTNEMAVLAAAAVAATVGQEDSIGEVW